MFFKIFTELVALLSLAMREPFIGLTSNDIISDSSISAKKSVAQKFIPEEDFLTTSSPEEKFHPQILSSLRYFEFLDKEFELRKPVVRNSTTVAHKVYQSYYGNMYYIYNGWIPAKLNSYSASKMTTIIFKQSLSRRQYGDFTTGQITLTLNCARDRTALLTDNTYITMHTNWDQKQQQHEFNLSQTQRIFSNKTFYSFEITEFIKSQLLRNLTKPNFINISFQAYNNNSGQMDKLDFAGLFDTNQDLPVIVLFFTDYVPLENNYNTVPRLRRSVKKREKRSSIRCQRQEFFASPEDLSWSSLVSPKMLDLGYCSGYCPFPLENRSYNFSVHTFLIDRYRHKKGHDLPPGFPRASCQPIQYKPLNVLEQLGPDLYRKERVDDISVARCGCR